eukprot:TRINITY_DN49175_c0_g1_i1.p1 TRINITY_DN49175_c0_g1~~TRINITY_DN49175_c0_g1_i1.p1  ORF type:complete len:322 (+),score=17.14 TRINITY_DN49175_c0_g1_i1:227-1192(+)
MHSIGSLTRWRVVPTNGCMLLHSRYVSKLSVRHVKRKDIMQRRKALALAADAAVSQQQALILNNVIGRRSSLGDSIPNVIAHAETVLAEPIVWSSPPYDEALQPLLAPMFADVYPLAARLPTRRVVIDSLVTEAEARYFTHDARDVFGHPLFDVDDRLVTDDSECSAARNDWSEHPLNNIVCERVCKQVRFHFGEERRLFLANAHLRKTWPQEQLKRTHSDDHAVHESGPYVCHVDKANIGHYDYSAVLYLSTQGVDFMGGQFAFNDPGRDEIVEPRVGRCVLFTSGPHHLHQAKPVIDGSRFIMALWFSLTRGIYECEPS